MERYMELVGLSELFRGLEGAEIKAMCACLGVRKQSFEKGGYVLRQGDEGGGIMLLVSGRLMIQRDDYWGRRSIISVVEPGDMFGEAYAMPGSGGMASDVYAEEAGEMLVFDARRVLTVCPSACAFHSRVVTNLFCAVSEKNRELVGKQDILSRRSTREKLMAYLSAQAQQKGCGEFDIGFDRQQLADFLAVDRSAMSRELGAMRDEGLISFSRRHFLLHGGAKECKRA